MQSVKLESLKSAKRAVLALAAVGMCGVLFAQDTPTNFGSPPGAPQTAPKLTQEQLDTLVAPIALYPDALLSQIMMAATYPLEVVEANRWISSNSNLSGDAFADALNQQPWDPSVKSLINTPTVLQMMDEKLDWTIKLGDAFLGQQSDVMGSVQRLRAQAQQAGNLQTTQQQRVTYVPNTADTITPDQPQQYIAIDDVDPDYAYVPVYDPFIIFGTWRYPHHPWFWHPHDYVATRGIWWGERYHYGPAWGYAWGRPDWARHDVEIDYRRNSNYDPRFNRADYLAHHPQLESHGGPAIWQHDPEHRLGVSYADPRIAQRYGGRTAAEDVRSREEYRGRVGATPQNLPNAHLPTLTNERLPNTEVHPQNDRAQDNRVQTDRAQNDRAQNDRAQTDARENAANDAARNASENAARDRENARNNTPTPQNHDDTPREVRPTPSAPPVEQRNNNADRGGAFNGANDRGSDAAADSARGEESRGGPHGSSGSEPAPARSSGGGGGGGSPHSGGSGGGGGGGGGARGGGSSGHR